MQYITLTQNKQAIVDDADSGWLNQWKWTFDGRYAQRNLYKNGGKKKLYMHRLIVEAEDGQLIDHINQNRLDNRRSNLRLADKSINGFNRGKQNNNTSGYKGVTRHTQCKEGRWVAQLQYQSKHYYIGLFKTREEASRAYQQKLASLV